MNTRSSFVLFALAFAACSKAENTPPADTSAPVASAPVAAAPGADPDVNVSGGAVPAGFTARADKDAAMSGAAYTANGDKWDVKTGPAHIVYSANTLGAGNYTASGTIEQLEAPTHPEAYGIFIGGRDLDKPTQAYTYFIVRGTGEMAVKVREGDKTRDVLKWTASADVPKADASGKATYALDAQVTGDAVRFSVNGKQVGSVSKVGLPTEGIAGLRINHNLHVSATPVTVKTP